MKRILIFTILLMTVAGLMAQPAQPARNTPAFRIVTGATLPATCSVADVYYKTGASAGTYNCTATNTWTLISDPTSIAPISATYITQTSNGTLSAEQALAGLSTGIMRVATTTGVITSLTSSTDIANNINDETGSGKLMFNASPAFGGTMQGETPAKIKLWMASAAGLAAAPSALGTDLADGVYTITVTGIDWAGGESGYPTAVTCTVNNAPAVTGRCAVSWTAIPGAASYRVYTSLAGNATPSRYFSAPVNSYNLDTLTGATVAALPAMNTAYSVSLDSTGNSWIQGGNILGPMTLTGQSLTGSMSNSLLDLATTWNTTGAPSAIRLTVTQTAANASALYLDILKGGTSLLKLRQDGRLDVNSDIFSTNGNLNGGAAIVNEIRANAGTEVRVGAYGLTGFKICATASNCTTESAVWANTTGIFTGTSRLVAAAGNEVAYAFNYTTNKNAGDDTGVQINWTNTLSNGTSIPFQINVVSGAQLFAVDDIGRVVLGSVAYAALGTPANGTIVYCSDCNAANPCTDSGPGAIAKRIAAAWVCN